MFSYDDVKSRYIEARDAFFKSPTQYTRDEALLALGRLQGYVLAGVATSEQTNDYRTHRGEFYSIINSKL